MFVHQYAYFALTSVQVPAAEIAVRVGIEPDEVRIPDGEAEDPGSAVEGMVKLPGQHQLLGWHLAPLIGSVLLDGQAALGGTA